MTNWNYGDVWETVADIQPEAPAVVQGDRHMSWRAFDEGADGIARYLLASASPSRTRWRSTSTTAPNISRPPSPP